MREKLKAWMTQVWQNSNATATILILLGAVLNLIAIHFGVASTQSLTLGGSLLLLLQAIGISLVGFAIFSVLVDTKSWREYFSSRLREIVIDQAYLKNLEPSKLRELQENAWLALYRDPSLGNEGSFLRFCSDVLHRFISEPFREEVVVEVFVSENGPTALSVKDILTYTCRRSGDSIQKSVRCGFDPNEVLSVKNVTIKLCHPPNDKDRQEWKQVSSVDLCDKPPENWSQEFVLEKYHEIDKLKVCVESSYAISPNAMQYWAMAHPTREFDLMLHFPKMYSVQIKPFVLRQESLTVSQYDGYARVRYSSWMLPESGVAWRLCPKLASVNSDGLLSEETR